MKVGGFKYKNLRNVGDHIQSLAAEQFLPEVDLRINRDSLANEKLSETVLLIMNAWFSHSPEICFPPANKISGLFWGFHVTAWNNSWDHVFSPANYEYLKQHEPIGCRDRYTADKLKEKGINSFYSKCLTLTFPKREIKPTNGYVILVDAQNIQVPNHLLKNSIRVSHSIPSNMPESVKFIYAKYLINLYREHASVVITSRLHCALPCVAMGIPVVFFGDKNDYRISILNDVGVEINDRTSNTNRQNVLNSVNWNPAPIDFEQEKKEMIKTLKRMIELRVS